MQIFIKGFKGEFIILNVEPSDTIEYIKDKIKEKEGISPDKYSLYFENELLYDNITLGNYNIQKEPCLRICWFINCRGIPIDILYNTSNGISSILTIVINSVRYKNTKIYNRKKKRNRD